jgi:hypothetical protein
VGLLFPQVRLLSQKKDDLLYSSEYMMSFNVLHELPITSFLIGIERPGLAVLVGSCQE